MSKDWITKRSLERMIKELRPLHERYKEIVEMKKGENEVATKYFMNERAHILNLAHKAYGSIGVFYIASGYSAEDIYRSLQNGKR